jgi:hypothetical protein
MSEPKNFLARWSRRKLEPSDSSIPPPAEKISPENKDAPPAAPEFDSTTLPPLESITAGSDIRAFLQTGVPRALTHAALRRAWSADPAIRDFIGLSENSWNFNAPDSIPGFGTLEPEHLRRLADQLLGDADAPAASAIQDSGRQPLVQTASAAAESEDSILHEMRQPAVDASVGAKAVEAQPLLKEDGAKVEAEPVKQTKVDGAAQYKDADAESGHASARPRHGGALPE